MSFFLHAKVLKVQVKITEQCDSEHIVASFTIINVSRLIKEKEINSREVMCFDKNLLEMT